VVDRLDLRRLSCRAHDIDEVVACWLGLKVISDDVRVAFDRSRFTPDPFCFEMAAMGGISTGRHRPNVDVSVRDALSDSYVATAAVRGHVSYHQFGAQHATTGVQAVVYQADLGPRVTELSADSDSTYLRLEPWVCWSGTWRTCSTAR